MLPFFEEHDLEVLRVLTDRGTKYCGREDRHPYQIFLGLNEIDHTRTKAKHPQTNGICERFHETCINEFYQITFRKKIYRDLETLQADLHAFLAHYNNERTHQGKRCQRRTPLQTFLDARELAWEKRLADGATAENGPKICSSEAAAPAAG